MKKDTETQVEATTQDAFDFLVTEDDTVKVSLEVYAVEANGKRIPKIIDKKVAQETKDHLEKDLADLKSGYDDPSLSTSDRLEVKRNIEIIEETIRQVAELLGKPTTTLTATFYVPTWEKDARVRQESMVETGRGETTWNEVAHVRAVIKHLLKEWDLKQPNPRTGKAESVPKTAYAQMNGDIVNAFVVKFEGMIRNADFEEKSKN